MSTAQQAQAPTSPPEDQPTGPASDYETIRAIVAAWPPAMRALLMHDLINILSKEAEERDHRRRGKPSDAIGILDMGQPAPTDEEVERIIQEHREAKYG